jgi:hypothetical protein
MTSCRRYSRNLLALSALALAIIALTSPASARENFAVLIGVNAYPNFGPKNQMRGPVNDVALMQSVLRARRFAEDHILMVADGIPGAQAPTRKAIVQTLADVTDKATRGDFVYLHFSGHGSQQPENVARTDRGHKPDGMNEIFLPRDTGAWSDKDHSVANVIVDFEMNTIVTTLRNKGVFVWAVFDSCHSGSMVRGAPVDDVVFRQVDPLLLGIPRDAIEKSTQQSAAAGSDNVRK